MYLRKNLSLEKSYIDLKISDISQKNRYRHGFIGVGRMEAKVVSVCLDFQAVSLISKSQSSPLKADEFEIC